MNTPEKTLRVWDPIVRIGHWTLAIAFFIAYLTEDDLLTQHVWAGYVVGIVVCVRLLWGFVGSPHARFVDFVRSPVETLRYVGDLLAGRAQRYIGHNPAGGAMVVLLLLSILATTFSGLVVYAMEEHAGPLAGWVTDTAVPVFPARYAERESEEHELGEFWEEVHEILANFTLLLVGLHIAGVLFSSYLHGENLTRGMFSGRKRRESASQGGGGFSGV